jgi:hypothetical protein
MHSRKFKGIDKSKGYGLSSILYQLVQYSFAGEPRTPPAITRSILEKLITPENAIIYIKSKGKNVLYI